MDGWDDWEKEWMQDFPDPDLIKNTPLPDAELSEPKPVDLAAIIAAIPQRDWIQEPLQVLSYGGGVQSTTMLLMIRDGTLPKPDIVIFSDTGSELPDTIQVVDSLGHDLCKEIGVPFAIVSADMFWPSRGRLHEDYHRIGSVPMVGIRSCTMKYKVAPQRKLIREIVGGGAGKVLADVWLGITTDEERRRGESDVKWTRHVYPLLDDVPMSRKDCLQILESEGLHVVKSGCFMCPYSSPNYWKNLHDNYPDLWKIALAMEEQLRNNRPNRKTGLYSYGKHPWLKDIHFQVSFESFFDGDPDKAPSCDSPGGCFL